METHTVSADIVTLISDLNPKTVPYTYTLPIDVHRTLKLSSGLKENHLLCQIELDPAYLSSRDETLKLQRRLLNLASQTENSTQMFAHIENNGFYIINVFLSKGESLNSIHHILKSLLEISSTQTSYPASKGEASWISI